MRALLPLLLLSQACYFPSRTDLERTDPGATLMGGFTWLNAYKSYEDPPAPTANGPVLSTKTPETWVVDDGFAYAVVGHDIFYTGGDPAGMWVVFSAPDEPELVRIYQPTLTGPGGFLFRMDFGAAAFGPGNYTYNVQFETIDGRVSEVLPWTLMVDTPQNIQENRPYAELTCAELVSLYPPGSDWFIPSCTADLICFTDTGSPECSGTGNYCVSWADASAHLDNLVFHATPIPTLTELPITEPEGC